jgi:hypothetical protein
MDCYESRKNRGCRQRTLFSLKAADRIGELGKVPVECYSSEVSLVDAKIQNANCEYRATEATKLNKARVIASLNIGVRFGNRSECLGRRRKD